MKTKYFIFSIVFITIISTALFISCNDDNVALHNDINTDKVNPYKGQEPTIDLKIIDESKNDSSIWIGYGTFYDELLWTSHNVYQGGIYYDFKSFGELVVTRVSENVFELYDPFKETSSFIENIKLSDDEMIMTANYIVDKVNYKMIYKDNINKAGIFELPIGEKLVISDNMSNSKVIPILVWKAVYYAAVAISATAVAICDDKIERGRDECARKGKCSKVQSGCKVKCVTCQ